MCFGSYLQYAQNDYELTKYFQRVSSRTRVTKIKANQYIQHILIQRYIAYIFCKKDKEKAWDLFGQNVL